MTTRASLDTICSAAFAWSISLSIASRDMFNVLLLLGVDASVLGGITVGGLNATPCLGAGGGVLSIVTILAQLVFPTLATLDSLGSLKLKLPSRCVTGLRGMDNRKSLSFSFNLESMWGV